MSIACLQYVIGGGSLVNISNKITFFYYVIGTG